MKKQKKGSIYSGFTLLEVLIALAISSLIFLVIISTYSLTMNTLEKWDTKEEDYYVARNIFNRMDNEISSIYSISDTKSFEGDEKTFSFYTTAGSIYFPFSCLMKITYKFITNDEGQNLLTREEEPLINFSLEENVIFKSYVWSEDLKDFSFKYSDGHNWYDSIKEGQKLQIVRITLTSLHKEKFTTIIYIPTGI